MAKIQDFFYYVKGDSLKENAGYYKKIRTADEYSKNEKASVAAAGKWGKEVKP